MVSRISAEVANRFTRILLDGLQLIDASCNTRGHDLATAPDRMGISLTGSDVTGVDVSSSHQVQECLRLISALESSQNNALWVACK